MASPTDIPGFASKAASVHDHLRRLAIHGLLRPGRRLAPGDIARELGTSETPVRDALVRLAEEGFIQADPGRGYFTKPPGRDEQRDLNEMLLAHHLCGLDLARPVLSDILRTELPAVEALAGDGDGDPARDLGEVYVSLAAASGNQVLTRAVRNAVDRTYHLRRLDCASPEGLAAQAAGLVEIGSQLLAGRREAALAASRHALDLFSVRLPDLLEKARTDALKLRFP